MRSILTERSDIRGRRWSVTGLEQPSLYPGRYGLRYNYTIQRMPRFAEKMIRLRVIRRLVFAFLLASAGLLAGCSPQYDWRTVDVADGRVRAMLPAKPQASERELDFEGHTLTFVLTSASVDGMLFTVGYAALPDALRADVSARDRLMTQTQASLYRNLGAVLPTDMPDAAERFTIVGQGQGRPLRLDAMVWTTQDALIEGIVIGDADAWPHDQIAEFLRELAPDQRPR